MTIKSEHSIDTGTVIFDVVDNIVISHVKPYIDVSSNQVDELKKVVDEYIDGDFGFISTRLRESEISINPIVWDSVFDQLPNIKVFAMVTDSNMGRRNFINIEKPMIELLNPGFPANTFISVEEAYNWVTLQL